MSEKSVRSEFVSLIKQRILVLDGAMGTMIQSLKLSEEGYRDGLVDRLRLLDAQKARLETRIAVVEAQAAWERAHEAYLSRFDKFSDIQDPRPASLVQLELPGRLHA